MTNSQSSAQIGEETKKSSRHNLEGKMINSENRNGNRLKKKKPNNLAADVSSVLNKTRSRRGSSVFDPSKFPQLSEERFAMLKKEFLVFDKDSLGHISTSDLKKLFENLGDNFFQENNLDNLLKSADPSNKGSVSFTKFVMLVEINKKTEEIEMFDPKDPIERQKAFAKFEHPGTGFVKYSNLSNLFECLGLDPPKEEIDLLISLYAQQHEGTLVEYSEFCDILENLKKEDDKPVEVDLPQHWMNDLQDVFSVFDNEEKGFIDREELILALKCLKMTVTDEELLEMTDYDVEGTIKLSKFMRMMERKIKATKLEATDTSKLTEEELTELEEAFALFDSDGDGTITSAELGNVMHSLGRKLTNKQLKQIVNSADSNNSGAIEFPELVSIMEQNTVRCSYLDEMRKAFGHFDKDGNGFISPSELRQAMERMKIRMGKIEFLLMLKRVDTDKDGQVNFKEFVTMMASDQNV